MTYSNTEIENYINGLSDLQREIILKTREIVLSSDTRMKEAIKWGSIAFFNKKNICGFRVAKTHVTLLFMEGSSLTDEYSILQGDGAKARTYKIASQEEINSKALTDLVLEALELGM